MSPPLPPPRKILIVHIAIGCDQEKTKVKRDLFTTVENHIISKYRESKDLLTEREEKNLSHLRETLSNFEKEKSDVKSTE